MKIKPKDIQNSSLSKKKKKLDEVDTNLCFQVVLKVSKFLLSVYVLVSL